MALVSELPILDVIKRAEDKHGLDTHMVIEVLFKEPEEPEQTILPESDESEVEEDKVIWLVEFENQKMIFDSFDLVTSFLLEEAVKTGDGPEVEIDYVEECDDEE